MKARIATRIMMATAASVLGIATGGCNTQQAAVQAPASVSAPVEQEVVSASPQVTVPAQGEAVSAVAVQIPEAVFCVGVKDRIPQGISNVFPPDVKKVFFFNRVAGAARPTAITHVWYWQEKQMAEVPLDVRSDNWRTWSSKRIEPAWKGSWAVKVLDENGDVVLTENFRIE